MIWQDWILGITTIIFSISLLPSVFGKDKPAILTSVTTGMTLIFVVFTQATLLLWVAAVASAVNCFLWFTLAFQKYRSKK